MLERSDLDLIDIASLSGETGKTPGTDLREGKRTLPVLNALASDDPADEELQTLLGLLPRQQEPKILNGRSTQAIIQIDQHGAVTPENIANMAVPMNRDLGNRLS